MSIKYTKTKKLVTKFKINSYSVYYYEINDIRKDTHQEWNQQHTFQTPPQWGTAD